MPTKGMIENNTYVASVCDAVKQDVGYLAPSRVVLSLGFPPEHPLHPHLRRHMYEHPTKPFLFWGATRVLKQLLKKGDAVAVWTDEYKERIKSSGLGDLDRHGDVAFILGEAKQQVIPVLFDHARACGATEMIVIDDQQANLQAVSAYAKKRDLPVRLVLVGNGDEMPEGPSTLLVSHVRQLARRARREFLKIPGKRLWVFDFNHTLLDTQRFEESMQREMNKIMKRNVIAELP